ncbi:trans-aconitate methyltransferase [Shinella sp. SUS2]|uniref:trans-aconitate 2-methyltransferase n=1 Tax=unclassified Shinella TaxID=2643062 RepID=UPI00067FA583|nr:MULTISPECIES: trans-aconitate 2-methyltransferase [unclassified Shinella]KNY13585.1 trans-aconitate methyltransferase [Shinella sp. SUS2]KOC72478.1 trans-aconitate methyltransferase [Shinella sp. GWS1]
MAWSAAQYLKFEDERTRPARDLLAQVPADLVAGTVYDLGCGPGNSTELLVERFPGRGVRGVDNAGDMLKAARQRLPGVDFVECDLARWRPHEPAALLFANAVFQWLPDPVALMARLMDGLRPGGVLAVQMPDNRNEPSHLLMEESALAGPWQGAFVEGTPRRGPMPAPPACFDALGPKAARVDVWHTVYNHPMANAAAIVDWVKATGLRPYLDRLPAGGRDGFLADYERRIANAYPPMADGRRLLRFPRLFIIAVKS